MASVIVDVVVVVVVVELVFGITAKISINTAGRSNPSSENSSGFDEFRHAKHHITEKITAIIIINVPKPNPRILIDDVV